MKRQLNESGPTKEEERKRGNGAAVQHGGGGDDNGREGHGGSWCRREMLGKEVTSGPKYQHQHQHQSQQVLTVKDCGFPPCVLLPAPCDHSRRARRSWCVYGVGQGRANTSRARQAGRDKQGMYLST